MKFIPQLALDVDGVLANFSEGLIDEAHRRGLGDAFPSGWRDVRSWEMSPRFHEVFRAVSISEDFWMNLRPLPFTSREVLPEIYLTSRPIPSRVTVKWLEKNGFPKAEVVTVSRPELKIQVLKDRDLFLVDDHHLTVQKAIDEKLEAYLFDAPHQRGYDVSHIPKINNLQELIERWGKNNG